MLLGASYRRDGDVIEIILHRPKRRNALGAAEWAVLEAAIAEAEEGACEVVVLRGEGDFFSAGVDLKWIEEHSKRNGLLKLIEANGDTVRRLGSLPQLVVVALNGPALGIGAHLALCGDIVLATRSSYLCFPEATLGIPDVLHFDWLERRLGRSLAMDMVVLGRRISADEALTRGVIGQVHEDLDSMQKGLSDYLARLRAVDPAVRRAIKAAAGRRVDADAQLVACAQVMTRKSS